MLRAARLRLQMKVDPQTVRHGEWRCRLVRVVGWWLRATKPGKPGVRASKACPCVWAGIGASRTEGAAARLAPRRCAQQGAPKEAAAPSITLSPRWQDRGMARAQGHAHCLALRAARRHSIMEVNEGGSRVGAGRPQMAPSSSVLYGVPSLALIGRRCGKHHTRG